MYLLNASKPFTSQFLFLNFLFSVGCFAQALSGKVINEKTGNGIPFATIAYKHKVAIATYANEKGDFSISYLPEDTLLISSVGYEERQFIAFLLPSSPLTLKLLPKEKETLPEVVVSKGYKGGKVSLLGYSHFNRTTMTGATKGAKVMVEIPNTFSNPKQIVELIFVLGNSSDDKNHRKRGIVRICLYAMDSICNKPGLNLLKKDIVVTVPKPILTYNLRIDLSKEGIFMPPCGVYVGLEFLGAEKEGHIYNINPGIWSTKQPPQYRKYYEFFGKEKFDLKNDGSYPMFGLRVK
jgi:hypothetical protein